MTPFEFALVLASALLHAVWSVSIKGSRDPLVFNLLQGLPVLGLTLVALPWLGLGQLSPGMWRLLALTGLTHALYLYWMSRAYEHGDLTLVYPIARSTPAFLPLLAVPLLGERLSPLGVLGIGVVVTGLWLVQLAPGLRLSAFTAPAARFAYLTLAATVVYSLADKAVMAELAGAPWSSPLPRAAAYCLLLWSVSVIAFSPLVLLRRRPRDLWDGSGELPRACTAALVSIAGYGLILRALETAPSSYVVAVRQTSVIFALVLGVARLRERPGRARMLGAVATVVGVALITWAG